ncbi:uncharacterized protein N7483_003617 [Penicillium malachiteum]|uniref:uncharacterized protein n=1 Tax=Penicillium malachiteum TaxID=1324776 RepID=UPI002547523F|nr:uncharacterized protein N7483_003617 [Penicillium malachiteum]KAJ5729109.1 hypothetical protein N7483_003617 [Penicillium malachiteum]
MLTKPQSYQTLPVRLDKPKIEKQFQFPDPNWWRTSVSLPVGAILLICLGLLVAIAYIKHAGFGLQGYPKTSSGSTETKNPAAWSWNIASTMEKGLANSDSPPPASAVDVLRPLSHGGHFPSSGAVAARIREQMQLQNASSSPPSSPLSSPETPKSDTHGPVQKRNETAQTMFEKDDDGARTFRRLIVEYN